MEEAIIGCLIVININGYAQDALIWSLGRQEEAKIGEDIMQGEIVMMVGAMIGIRDKEIVGEIVRGTRRGMIGEELTRIGEVMIGTRDKIGMVGEIVIGTRRGIIGGRPMMTGAVMIGIKDKEMIGEIVIGGIMKGIKEEVVEIGEVNQGGQL